MIKLASVIAITVIALAYAGSASAVTIVGDPIYAQWENPVTTGTVLDGATGKVYTVWTDPSTAVFNLGASSPSASTTIQSGASSATPPPPTYSSVTFTGNPQIPATKGTVPFQLGSISYTNGTSNLGTGLFGATLVLYAHDALLGNVPIGSLNFSFTGTVNDGSQAQNADYLNIQGVSQSFNVYEGATATGGISGEIVGDPMVTDLFFTLDLNQDADGFLGTNSPAPAAPLPTTLPLLASGLGAMGLFGWRRQQKAQAVAI